MNSTRQHFFSHKVVATITNKTFLKLNQNDINSLQLKYNLTINSDLKSKITTGESKWTNNINIKEIGAKTAYSSVDGLSNAFRSVSDTPFYDRIKNKPATDYVMTIIDQTIKLLDPTKP
jgi:hypothetical protein